MSSVNKVELLGNVGNVPEVRSAGDTRVCNLSLATSYKDKTEWHRLVVWGKLSDVVEKYVGKGDKLYVSGRLETRKWTDKDGIERYTTEVVVNDLCLLGNKTNGGNKAAIDEDVPF